MNDRSETITDILRTASQAVRDAGVPETLQATAFERVVDALLNDAGLTSAPSTDPSSAEVPAGGDAQRQAPPPPPPDDPLALVAERAGRTLEEIRDVFHLEGDRLDVVVGHRRIASGNAAGSRELTLLVAGARQAAGLEEHTSLSVPRELCRDFGRLDVDNYASTIKKMDDVFTFYGRGANREVRLKRPGWDTWSELVGRLVQADS